VTLVILSGCVRQYGSPSDPEYFTDRRACIQHTYRASDATLEWWSPELFTVYMRARGWP